MPPVLCVRASDGATFELSAADLKPIENLEQLQTQIIAIRLNVPVESQICMNEEGVQLRDESIPLLKMFAAESHLSDSFTNQTAPVPNLAVQSYDAVQREKARERAEKRIYIFERDHLDADPQELADALAITEEEMLDESPLDAADPLQSHIALSHHNLVTLQHLNSSINLQKTSLDLAFSNLSRVLSSATVSFENFQQHTVKTTLSNWERLLDRWQDAMDAIVKVKVLRGLSVSSGPKGHRREFSGGFHHLKETSGSIQNSTTSKEVTRFLGDYVSREKMAAVEETCIKVLNDLKTRTLSLENILKDITNSTQQIRLDLDNTSKELEDLVLVEKDSWDGHLRVEELVAMGEKSDNPELLEEYISELLAIDAEARYRIGFLVERKNAMTRYLLITMQNISSLQSELAPVPANLGMLDHDFRTKTDNFKHFARLEGLIPAYIAETVEVVRRRSYNHLLSDLAATLITLVSNLNTVEKTRRTRFRTTYAGTLPWESKALSPLTDELVPSLDLEIKHGLDDLPDLDIEALEWLSVMFDEIGTKNTVFPGSSFIHQGRELLASFMTEIQGLQDEFAISSGAIVPMSTPPKDIDEDAIKHWEAKYEELERQIQAERSAKEVEVTQMHQEHAILSSQVERDRVEFHTLVGQINALSEGAEKNKELHNIEKKQWKAEREILETANRKLQNQLNEANAQVNILSKETESSAAIIKKLEINREDAYQSHARLNDQYVTLGAEHDAVKWDLKKAKDTMVEMQSHINMTEKQHREIAEMLSEKGRQLRNQQNEYDLEKAVFEKTITDLRRTIELKNAEISLNSERETTLEGIKTGLQEQIARWETLAACKESEADEAKSEALAARRERELGIVSVQKNLVQTNKIAREAIKVSGRLKEEITKILGMLTSPASGKEGEVDSSGGSTPHPPLDYDHGDLETLLQQVQAFDKESLSEAVMNKVENLNMVNRKWSKEAKAYREKVHRQSEKIAFRNFTKGDYALFLPTRNSTIPVWAAFNVSFPHHFLAATGVISEQMKSREWIVAKIVSISERTVDVKDPSTNPYLLAPGTKYFVLEVEPWSSKDSSRRKSNSDKKRSEERRKSSRSEHVQAQTKDLSASTVVVESPQSTKTLRRATSLSGLPTNATALARSEYAIVEEEPLGDLKDETSSIRRLNPDNEESPSSSPPVRSGLALSLGRPSGDSNPFSYEQSKPENVTSTPTEYDPVPSSPSTSPAFLPARGSQSTIGRSGSGQRAISSLFSSSISPGTTRSILYSPELGTSPGSASGSNIIVRSASSGGSSVLSNSIIRRSGNAFQPGTSPNNKTSATQESQDGSSRWESMQQDLNKVTKTVERDSLKEIDRRSMTIGRNTKGWTGLSSERKSSNRSIGGGFLESLQLAGRLGSGATNSSASSPPETGQLAASEIMRRLKRSSKEMK